MHACRRKPGASQAPRRRQLLLRRACAGGSAQSVASASPLGEQEHHRQSSDVQATEKRGRDLVPGRGRPLLAARLGRAAGRIPRAYNQHTQKSHDGLHDYQTPFVPHAFRYEPSKPLQMPWSIVMKRTLKHGVNGFPICVDGRSKLWGLRGSVLLLLGRPRFEGSLFALAWFALALACTAVLAWRVPANQRGPRLGPLGLGKKKVRRHT